MTAVRCSCSRMWLRIGFRKLTEAAVLSPMIATLFRPLVGGVLGQLHQEWHDLFGLRIGGRRGLEHVMEAAIGNRVGIGQREPRQLGPLADLGCSQREGRQPAADTADHVGVLRHQALRRILRGFGRGAGIDRQELQLRPAEGLDTARLVDVVDRHLGAGALEHALLGPRAGQRHQQRDLDLLRLRGPRLCGQGRRADHPERRPSSNPLCHFFFLQSFTHRPARDKTA